MIVHRKFVEISVAGTAPFVQYGVRSMAKKAHRSRKKGLSWCFRCQ